VPPPPRRSSRAACAPAECGGCAAARAAAREHPAHLTPREVEVLALIEEGLRNRQIADRLFVSAKTVDHHVGAILRKLGVHTRGEAAAAARRLGLASDGD
jgi:DNA-binding NarL/FixJ family response regulator